MKTFIEKLRQYAAGDDFQRATEQAADALERLELEAVAATLRIENDAREIAKLLTTNSGLVRDKESDRLAYLATRDERDAYRQAADTQAMAHKVERDGLELEAERYRAELLNIVNAERYNDEHFSDDSCFADWVQSRARFTAVKETK